MNLTCENQSGVTIVMVEAIRIDAAAALQFKDQMRHLREGASARIILDLDRVEFVDSSGLGAIVAAMKMVAPDRTLELANLNASVEKVFRLTRMDSVFVIHSDVAAGVSASTAA